MKQEIINQSIKNNIEVLYFSAVWCGPCRVFGPTFDDWSKKQVNVTIKKINVDENQSLATTYNIKSIPTILFLKNGEIVNKLIGPQSKNTLQVSLDTIKK